MNTIAIKFKYRVDRRIKVAEITTRSKVFLTDLDIFMLETGIAYFEESTIGEAIVSQKVYKALWEGRVTSAEPHSFRFRRAKEKGIDE